MKRVVALSLIILQVFLLIPICTRPVHAEAKMTATEALEWAESQLGKSLDYDKKEGAQCVDLIYYYYAALGAKVPGGNACAFATHIPPEGWTITQGGKPQKGDILVYVGGWGHVAIYIDDNTAYHQNWNGQYVKKVSRPYDEGFTAPYENDTRVYEYYWGCIHPDFRSEWLPWNDTEVKAGTYMSIQDTTIRVAPYEDAEKLTDVPLNVTVLVTGAVTNGYNNLWYKVNYGDYEGYVYGKRLEWKFSYTEQYYIDVNGTIDGEGVNALDGIGTFDVYINDKLVKDDVSDYYVAWPYGTRFEIRDIKGTYNTSNTGKTIAGTLIKNVEGTKVAGMLQNKKVTVTLKYVSSSDWAVMTTKQATIKNVAANKVLNVTDGIDRDGAQVDVWNDIGSAAQKWYIYRNGSNGGYNMRPSYTNRVLNMWGVTPYSGANVTLYRSTEDSTQWVNFKKVGGSRYTIHLVADPNLVLDVDTNGNCYFSTYREGNTSQIWDIYECGTTPAITPAVTPQITITPVATPEITPTPTVTPTLTVTPTVTVTPSTEWATMTTDQVHLLNVATNRLLNVTDGLNRNGAQVDVWNDIGTPAQKWYIYQVGNNDGYNMRPSYSERVLNMWGEAPRSGVNATLYDYVGDSTQWVKFKEIGNGRYTIHLVADTSLVLDVDENETCQFVTYNEGKESQIWVIYQVGTTPPPEIVEFEIDANGVLTKYNGAGGDVVIPSGVVKIGDGVFSSRTDITSVVIPQGVTVIGVSAFYECSNMKNITIPTGVTTIEKSAFYGCSGLTTVTIPTSVTAIKDNAFYSCKSLTTVSIPKNVSSIGASAFEKCTKLKSVTLSEGVKTIGNNAFYGCTSLTGIKTPKSLRTIGEKAFGNCISLSSVSMSEGVTTIKSGAFSGCSGLIGVVLPESTATIETNVFANCSKLENITIPKGVNAIGTNTFAGCPGDILISGYFGSYAESYAREAGIRFKPLNSYDGTQWLGTSIDLSDIVNLKFYCRIDRNWVKNNRIYANVVYANGRAETIYLTEDKVSVLEDGTQAYMVECKIAPKEIGDAISIQLVNGTWNENCTEVLSYSVKQYCEALLASDTCPDSQRDLIQSLLNYSTYAQLYFGYKTANLTVPKADAFISSQAKVKEYLDKIPQTECEGNLPDGIHYYGCSLVLNSSILYRMYFTVDDETLAKEYGLRKNNNNGYYYLEDISVSVTQLCDIIEFHVGDAVIKSCPLSYVRGVVNGNNGVKLTELCVAVFDYYAAARDYIEYQNTGNDDNETAIGGY